MKTGVFITGTDTGVGKTLCSSLLLASLFAAKKNAGYWKPVQTGDDDDTTTVSRLTEAPQHSIAQPAYRFSAPAAPSRAAALEGKRIDFSQFLHSWKSLRDCFWIVEGAGGLLVPLGERRYVLDIVSALEIPLLLVASSKLGTINHTLLSLRAAKSAGIRMSGIILSGDDDPDLENFLIQETGIAIIPRIPLLPEISVNRVQHIAALWAKDGTLRSLCGFKGDEENAR